MPEGNELATEEEIIALLHQQLSTPVWPSAAQIALPEAKGSTPKLICLDMKDWVALGRAHYGKNKEHTTELARLQGLPLRHRCRDLWLGSVYTIRHRGGGQRVQDNHGS